MRRFLSILSLDIFVWLFGDMLPLHMQLPLAIVLFAGAVVALVVVIWRNDGRVQWEPRCVCSPGREMETTYGTTDAIEAALERHRHEMSVAIETERHHSELQRIHEKRVADAIDRYNRQHAPQPQTPQLPQPVRRTVPRLPAPNTVEIPIETQTTDGYRWVALEKEIAECQS